MAIRLSTGLQASLLSQFGLQAMMNYGVIDVYTGPQPETASDAPTGTRIARVTQSGLDFIVGGTIGGLQCEYSSGGGGLINVGEWRLRGITDGAPGWWRWKWNSQDDNSQSFFLPRMDGLVGQTLVLSTNQISEQTNLEIASFLVAFTGE